MQRNTVHDFRPSFPRSPDFDGEIKQKEEGDGAAAAVCTPPLTNDTHDSVIPADQATLSAERGEKGQPRCDGLTAAVKEQVNQPEGVNQTENHEEAQVVKERVNDSPKEKRLSNRSTLLRSCSVDNIALLYRGNENPPETQLQKSSKEVKKNLI